MIDFIKRFFGLKKYTIDDFNLDEKTKLKFSKVGYNEYTVAFFHPLYKKWWTLPEQTSYVWIHGRWNLLSHGSFGSYGSYKLTCKYEEVESYKRRFETINQIKLYLRPLEKGYEDWLRRNLEKNKNYPKTIK